MLILTLDKEKGQKSSILLRKILHNDQIHTHTNEAKEENHKEESWN